MKRYWGGFWAGLLATAPMTASMLALKKSLPAEEDHALPPRSIVKNVSRKTIGSVPWNKDQLTIATLLSHFGFGAVTGSLYSLLAAKSSAPPLVKGLIFGLGVWTLSYRGWLPLLGIFSKDTTRREGVMIAAHVIWGLTLGALESHFNSEQ